MSERRPDWKPKPARGYSWEPFGPGNVAAVRSGAFSRRLVSERAAQLHAELMERCPWLVETDAVTVDSLCRARARLLMLDEHISKLVEEGGVAAVRPYLWSEASRAEANVAKFEADLGLSPAGRGRLARDLGQAAYFGEKANTDLAALGHRGRKVSKLRALPKAATDG